MPVRVLLVEDNEVFREALELMLGMREEVEIVAGPEHGPDVVLIVNRNAARQMQTQLPAQLADLPVVALTGDEELDEIVAAIEQAAAS